MPSDERPLPPFAIGDEPVAQEPQPPKKKVGETEAERNARLRHPAGEADMSDFLV